MFPIGIASGLMNTTPIVAMLVPATRETRADQADPSQQEAEAALAAVPVESDKIVVFSEYRSRVGSVGDELAGWHRRTSRSWPGCSSSGSRRTTRA